MRENQNKSIQSLSTVLGEMQKRQHHARALYLTGFTAILTFFGAVLMQVKEQQEKEKDVDSAITNYAAAYPNYLDSLVIFDTKNAAQMVELDRLVNGKDKNGPIATELDKKILSQKINERNQLVVKKAAVNQLIEQYAGSLMKAKKIKRADLYLQRQGYIR